MRWQEILIDLKVISRRSRKISNMILILKKTKQRSCIYVYLICESLCVCVNNYTSQTEEQAWYCWHRLEWRLGRKDWQGRREGRRKLPNKKKCTEGKAHSWLYLHIYIKFCTCVCICRKTFNRFENILLYFLLNILKFCFSYIFSPSRIRLFVYSMRRQS